MNRFDVAVAGAGPVGLFLACELGLAGVSVVVLERDAGAESPWKAPGLGLRGLNTASMEAFDRRGLLDGLIEPGRRETLEKTDAFEYAGHFAGIVLDANLLSPRASKYKLPGPSLVPGGTHLAHIEATLTKRAADLGVVIVRGAAVTGFTEDADGVTVHAGDRSFRASWLVGCDGGHSVVRKSAGFSFAGTEPMCTGYVFRGTLDAPEKLAPGFHRTARGLFIVGDVGQIYLLDFDGGAFDRRTPLDAALLTSVLRRITGVDATITELVVSSSFTDRAMQASTYRKGRVLLAGDSAHIHSPLSAQGLNAGIGDAMNLGWKLASVVRGHAPDGLLDSYTSERHPIGAAVVAWSRAQVATLQPNAYGDALGDLLTMLLATPDGTSAVIARVWGLTQRYDLGDPHPIVGMSAPDFTFDDGTRLGERCRRGRPLLIDFTDDAASLATSALDYVAMGTKNALGLRALLVRPDGIVAWVADDAIDLDAARAAIARWVVTG